jgi:probable H4MPT-linked C1 transfer pathway protein
MILGWDIGGVNTKVARLTASGELTVCSRPFELQRDPEALVGVLIELAGEVGVGVADRFTCAVTMTAELSQMFRTKREGVGFVLDAVSAAFPKADVRVFTTGGQFLSVDSARRQPIDVAAANWTATAWLIAPRYRAALLLDVGTTTTDIIPIVDGEVVALGKTDPDRLASGELVYTGALRTPVEAIVRDVPYRDGRASVSAEAFALIGDVHLWRGRLAAAEYTVPTPDSRAVTREFVGERIARVICADRELLDESAIRRIAESVAAEQVSTIAAAIRRVRSRHPSVQTAVVTGLGAFIARDAAQAAGLDVVSLADDFGVDGARYAPAAAVALLWADDAWRERCHVRAGEPDKARPTIVEIDLMIKVGGGLLEHVAHLDRVLTAIAEVARAHRVVVVPGGGPFADAVREADGLLGLGDDAAHWMAILGMDQYAHLLGSRFSGVVVVSTREEIDAALRQQQIPVLAPSRWLSSADPLPHSWDVTSDSIAAWLAGELGARRLLLVKPPDAGGAGLVDAYFERALPRHMPHDCLAADEAVRLLTQMAGIVNPAFETT